MWGQAGVLPAGVMEVTGRPGSGVTSTLLSFLAAPSQSSPVAYVDVRDAVSPVAAMELGCDLERVAFVNAPEPEQWGRAVGYLLDGVPAVAAEVPRRVPAATLRAICARARARARLLVLAPLDDRIPSGLTTGRLALEATSWSGVTGGRGHLTERRVRAALSGKLARGTTVEGWLCLPSLEWETAKVAPALAVAQ